MAVNAEANPYRLILVDLEAGRAAEIARASARARWRYDAGVTWSDDGHSLALEVRDETVGRYGAPLSPRYDLATSSWGDDAGRMAGLDDPGPRRPARDVWLERSIERQRQGQLDGALAAADRLCDEVAPFWASSYWQRACVRALAGDPGGAVDDIDRALAADPAIERQLVCDPDFDGLRDHPRFAPHLYRRLLVESDFAAAIALDPGRSEGHRGRLGERWSDGVDARLAVVDAWRAALPDTVEPWVAACDATFGDDRFDAAVEALAGRFPGRIETAVQRARRLERDGDRAGCLACLEPWAEDRRFWDRVAYADLEPALDELG